MGPMWGQAAQQQQQQQQQNGCQQRQSGQSCDFFKSLLQKNFQGCPRNQETKQEERKEKEECGMKAEETESTEDDILDKAQFLSQYGFEFNKCYQWAQTYPRLPKEALLEFCLSSPGFLESHDC